MRDAGRLALGAGRRPGIRWNQVCLGCRTPRATGSGSLRATTLLPRPCWIALDSSDFRPMFHVEHRGLPERRFCWPADPAGPAVAWFSLRHHSDRPGGARSHSYRRTEAEGVEAILGPPGRQVGGPLRWFGDHQAGAGAEEPHRAFGGHGRAPERAGDHQVERSPELRCSGEILGPPAGHTQRGLRVRALRRRPRGSCNVAAANPAAPRRRRASRGRARGPGLRHRNRGRGRFRRTRRWRRRDPGCARDDVRPARDRGTRVAARPRAPRPGAGPGRLRSGALAVR